MTAAWLTAAELAGLPGMPKAARRVRDRAAREGWPSRPRSGRGGGAEYAVAGLPAETRAALAARLGGARAAGGRAALKSDLDARAAGAARDAGLAAAAGLDDAERAAVDARAYLVRACDGFTVERGLARDVGQEAFAAAYRDGTLAGIDDWVRAAVPSLTGRVLRKWAARLQRDGLIGLADRRGRHRRGAGRVESDAEVRDLIVGLIAATPHASAKHAMRALRARFKDAPERVPAYRTMQRFMANWRAENAQLFAAISNPDAWRSKYQAAGGKADEDVVRLNQLWEMDSTPFDLALADGTRHAVIGAIDVWSRRVKFLLARTSNSVAICALSRRCLLDWGVPETVKTDQGADYKSRHFTGVLAALDIAHEQCPPFTPEMKPFVERAFGTLVRDLVELLPGFTGHNVAERQAIRNRRSFADRMMKKGAAIETGMSAAEVQAFLDRWADDVYAHDAHNGLGGKTPFERAAEWPHPPSAITDPRALDVLLAEAPGDGGWRVVTKKGIRVDGLTYDHPALGGLEGRRVKVRYDEADVGRLYVHAEDGGFVGIAEAPEVTGVSRREVSARRKAGQKNVMSEGRRALKAVANRAKVKDIVGEIMAHRAAEAGRLVAFPRARVAHETDALMEAARAAAGEPRAVRELTPEQKAAADATFAAMTAAEAPDNVTRFTAPPRGERPFFATDQDWARWIIDNRGDATPDEEARLRERMRSKSFRLLVGRDWETEDGRRPAGHKRVGES